MYFQSISKEARMELFYYSFMLDIPLSKMISILGHFLDHLLISISFHFICESMHNQDKNRIPRIIWRLLQFEHTALYHVYEGINISWRMERFMELKSGISFWIWYQCQHMMWHDELKFMWALGYIQRMVHL